jgi:predicted unusual protein kinase regulating ubiquinone biosynthesis (AarF/ABC1/UbiB family)
MPAPKPPVRPHLETGALARGLSLARLSASAGIRAVRFNLGNLFAPDDTRAGRLATLVTEQTAAVVRELGLLKGSAMKVGQMLSMVGDGVLPPQAIALLRTLQSQAPPLPWPSIEAVLRVELGAEKLATLEIDPVAVASASLGQVHRAVRRSDGARLALKVQYPGVDQAIDSDLRVLRRLLGVANLLPGGARFDDLFDEVRLMMHQELSYTRELSLTDQHRAHAGGDPRYVLPRTFPELSSPRVLTTSFEEGLAVDGPEVAALSQERRDALGLAAFEFTLNELTRWRCVQTDPHFGNYRIRLGLDGAPDRIVMFDFGAVRAFEGDFLDRYLALARGAAGRDAAEIERGARGLGLLLDGDPPAVCAAVVALALTVAEPLGPATPASAPFFTADGRYRWGESDLPRRAMRQGGELVLAASLRAPPREMIFLDRKLGGTFFFLATLRAVVQVRPLVEAYLGLRAASSAA